MPSKSSDAVPLYRRVIRDAWHIAWHHKHLWIFGFFATFIGFGGTADIFMGGYDKVADVAPTAWPGSPLMLVPGVGTMKALMSFSPYPFLSLTIFLAVGAVMTALLAWIVTVSIGALIASIKKIERGGDADFLAAMKFGASNFWQLFGVNVVVRLVIFLAFLITSANLFTALRDRDPVSILMYVGTFIAYLGVSICAGLTGVYASVWTTVKGTGVTESLRRGWKNFSQHWLVSIENGLLLLLVGSVVGLAMLLALMIVSVPLIFLLLLAVALKAQALIGGVIALAAIILIFAIVLVGSFLTTLQVASWTVLWTELNEGKPVAKLVRLARKMGWK